MAELIQSLGIEWPILIAQVVNFAILLGILWKFVYTPVMKLLDERRDGVRTALLREEHAAAKLAAAETDKANILAESRAESQKIIEAAKKDAEELKQKIIIVGKEEIQRMKQEAERKLHADKMRLITEVRGEIGNLIVGVVERALGDVLDTRAQGKMVEQALAVLREQNGSPNIESRNSKKS